MIEDKPSNMRASCIAERGNLRNVVPQAMSNRRFIRLRTTPKAILKKPKTVLWLGGVR